MRRLPPLPLLFATTLLISATCGCSPHAPAKSETPAGKQYPVRGKVVSTDPAHGQVTLDAATIPGFMDAMTMPYRLKNPALLSELHPGDQITATLFITPDQDVLDQIVVTDQGQPDYKPPVFYHPLSPGDAVPNFKLVNQSGKLVHLDQFRGKILLLTFIYTRCPLPEFCVRMSRNFAKIDTELAKDPALYARTHLLSVSFDPDYDTPEVLRSYGGAYTGRYTKETFSHWDFAAPPKTELAAMTKFFVIGVTPEQDKTITHSLSTVIIGPDGKVFRWYPTNDWDPAQLLNDVKQLAASQSK